MEKDKLIIKTLIDIYTCLDNLGHFRCDPIQPQLDEIEKNIKELEELNAENIG